MKQSIFLKAAIVASILAVNTFPLLASEVVKESTIKSKPSIGEKLDDTVITTQVKMALLLHRSTSTLRTEITTSNGVVVIDGSVENSAEKELITKLVEDVQGVKGVENKMIVSTKETSTVGEKLDDSVITAKVKMALVIHRSTGVLRTSITTNDAVVTVSGKAKNIAERELVSKVIEDVDGVKSVVNKMMIE
jgi:osmotically-inducible protein OsmY